MLARLQSTKFEAAFTSNVFRPLLFFLGMSSAKLPFIKDTTPFSVVMYYDWFMRDPLNWESYRVVQVNCYKDMGSGGQHEQVIAKITTAECGVFGYLCFERMRGSTPSPETLTEDPTDTEKGSTQLVSIENGIQAEDFTSQNEPMYKRPSLNPSSLSSFSSPSDSVKMRANAEDTVTQVDGFPTNPSPKKKNTGVQLVATLHPRHKLFLYDLVVLTYTIHTQNPIYILVKEQCYWFANMIMCALLRGYGHDDAKGEHADGILEGAGGKWHSIRVHKATEDMLGDITSQFETNLEAFKARVQQVKSAEEQSREDRLARLAAERRAKQAEAMAKDSEARAEEMVEKDRMARVAAEERARQFEERVKQAEDRARQAFLEVAKFKELRNHG